MTAVFALEREACANTIGKNYARNNTYAGSKDFCIIKKRLGNLRRIINNDVVIKRPSKKENKY